MCGIVGYVGDRLSQDILLGGLGRLEYRGYDSAGIAVVDGEGQLHHRKRAGKLQVLRDDLAETPLPDGNIGIGHTRWATHGAPTDANAHPHLADDGKLAVVHNGIIENFTALRAELLADGVTLLSETDTEVAAHLLGREYRKVGNLEQAFRNVVTRLDGAFSLVAVHQDQPDVIVAARLNSPLVIGLGEGENFLGSDVAAFVEHTQKAIAVGQAQMVVVRKESVEITTFDGQPAEGEAFDVDWDAAAADKGGWSSFMAKEIAEDPQAVEDTIRGRITDGTVRLPDLEALSDEYFRDIDRILLIACGTAYYSGLTGAYALEQWTGVPVAVELAHEFRYREPVITERTLVVSLSQSGETMDTLLAVRFAREAGAKTISICNTQGATIPRESDSVVYTYAGPEVAVASTKAFVAQIAAIYLLGLHIAKVRETLTDEEIRVETTEFQTIPDKLRETLTHHESIKELAGWMADTRSVLFLGRHTGYPIALEGALKLKEIAYIHAEGFAAGELKHGPIALIEPGQPVFVMVPSPRHDNGLHAKIVSNIEEIRARGAHVLAVAEGGDASVMPYTEAVFATPPTSVFFEPFLKVVPLQIFALELSTAKGLDVDQPRNLAKSVTVE
ncbi:glutamine--fructose-6-phosphate transaminase (isomerizing) [Gulosibacter chungangensis]|uniref:Glutamine--fructose-6-phosphate aminotransferase [isomerizing] n=1 Tax=Gulosibacter chungangensis TaxID=979746 RepID=A0A7J5B9G3_9MICO|nr:glutamine--fructose-6-phosphate transaminase (isomerizing) [Gulosibacter chungangensis]KAB1641675.1 glutamine--fructose-6-phosphate transaminase (isomerizing) [Gulosibacter chungangensis]